MHVIFQTLHDTLVGIVGILIMSLKIVQFLFLQVESLLLFRSLPNQCLCIILISLFFSGGRTTACNYVYTWIIISRLNFNHLYVLCRHLLLLLLHSSNQNRTIFDNMSKLSIIPAGLSRRVQTVARIVSSISTVIEN